MTKFSPIVLKNVKIVNGNKVDLFFKDRGVLLNSSIRVFIYINYNKYLKVQIISVKNGFKYVFNHLSFSLLEIDTLKLRSYSSSAQNES